jgi:hypothetical protein
LPLSIFYLYSYILFDENKFSSDLQTNNSSYDYTLMYAFALVWSFYSIYVFRGGFWILSSIAFCSLNTASFVKVTLNNNFLIVTLIVFILISWIIFTLHCY